MNRIATFATILTCAGLLALAGAPAGADDSPPASQIPGLTAPGMTGEGKGDGKSADRLEQGENAGDGSEKTARLDALFERLASAKSKRRADAIAGRIQRDLARSGSPTVDLLMQQAGKAIEAKEYGPALDVLDAIVRLEPDFAEGWNRRATVHFMREDFGRSLADIERVLELEPRHWGALSGLAIILVQLEQHEEALAAIDAALAVHPFLEELQEQREKLLAKVNGADI